MLEFNIGELTTRLRKALGVRGRMPLGLDEHVIPVTLTADVTGPPWRTNPSFAQGASRLGLPATNAGDYALVRLQYPATVSEMERGRSVFLVTGWMLQPNNTVIASGAAVADNEALAIFRPSGAGVSAGFRLTTTERHAPAGTSIVPYLIPIELVQLSVPTSPPSPVSTDGLLQWVRAGVVQPPAFVPTETLLRPGDAIEFWSTTITSATNSSGLIVTVQGLFYGLGGN